MKSKWKLFIIVFIVTVVGLFAWTKVSDNLSTYSVYYAKHTEGIYSPLQETMRNFNQIDLPKGYFPNYIFKVVTYRCRPFFKAHHKVKVLISPRYGTIHFQDT